MIQIRFKLTLPLLLVLLIALAIWLMRDPGAGSAHPVRQQPQTPPRAPRRRKAPTAEPLIITQADGDPVRPCGSATYSEALAAGVTGEQLREIGDREAFESAKVAYAEALADPTYRAQIDKLRAVRTRHADPN